MQSTGGGTSTSGADRVARPSYTPCVTAEYMHHLVDRLSQVAQTRPAADSSEEESGHDGLLALIGSIDGAADLGERHDDYIRARFGDSV